MFEYFAVLHVVASSAAEPASWAAAATCELANGQMTFTFQVSGFPASQGTRERPSSRFPSDRLRPSGSLVIIIIILTPVLNSQGMKKITLCNTKKYKNQAGMNLTPPPSQNSHAVIWHCTAESEQRVAEIKSRFLSHRLLLLILFANTSIKQLGIQQSITWSNMLRDRMFLPHLGPKQNTS